MRQGREIVCGNKYGGEEERVGTVRKRQQVDSQTESELVLLLLVVVVF